YSRKESRNAREAGRLPRSAGWSQALATQSHCGPRSPSVHCAKEEDTLSNHATSRVFGAPAAVASVLLPLSVAAQDQATLATAMAVSYVPSRAAADFGWFKAEGLDLNIKVIVGGNDAIQGLASGTLEFGESSHAQFLAAAAKDLPIVAIGLNSYGFLGK